MDISRTTRKLSTGILALGLVLLPLGATQPPAQADADPARGWAHVVVATGYVNNVSVCTWAVCGDPESFYRQDHERRGIMLLDLDAMSLAQQPGPGWWYVDGTFVRDSFERNLTATARILGVELRWSAGGLGAYLGDVTFTVEVAPTGQRFTTSDTSLLIDPLDAGVEHTFTVTATRSDGTTVQGPTVRATPQADPDPDCTDRSVARECRAATGWAVIDPATMLVANVIVCTPWRCGADGELGGRMPADTPWPNFLLIELDGPGGIGWKYVDGVFVDVRPREELEAETPSAPPTTEPSPATDSPGTDNPGTDAPGTDAPEPSAAQPEASAPTAETAAPSGPASRTDAPGEADGAVVDERPAQGPIRRVLAGIVSFLLGLFGN